MTTRDMRTLAGSVACSLVFVSAVWTGGCGGLVAGDLPEPPAPPPAPTLPPPSTPTEDTPPAAPPPTGEPVATTGAIPKNSCLTLVGSITSPLAFGSIDLATGAVTQGIPLKLATGFTYDPSSIAVLDEEVLFCDSHRIVRASRVDGSITFINYHRCEGITASPKGTLFVIDDVAKPIVQYPDVESLRTNQNGTPLSQLHASRLGPSPDGLVASWHSSNEVLKFGSAVTLEGYDDWIFGLSGASGGRIVVSSPRANDNREGVIAFDATTGKKLGVIAYAPETPFPGVKLGFKGLACAY